MIQYVENVENLHPEQLEGGFFAGWPTAPDAETHLRLMQQSSYVWLALDDQTNQIVGFIISISDGVLSAYIPLLEVLPDYRGLGIGHNLVQRMLQTLQTHYMVDLVCDDSLRPFYERFGMQTALGMAVRNYGKQSGMK